MLVHNYIHSYLQTIFPEKNTEILLDRFCKRTKGTKTSNEQWHRDITNSPNLLKEDKIFWGWINLDKKGSKSQGFSCIPGSQTREDKTGFVKFTDKENKEFEKKEKNIRNTSRKYYYVQSRYSTWSFIKKKRSSILIDYL